MAIAADDEIVKTFHDLVNMSPTSLKTWLDTDESREVGCKTVDGAESIGHKSGRDIVELLGKKKDAYDERDRKAMHRVVGYIKRHMAQRPAGDTAHTRWAASLKNWGHDPGKT